MLGFLLILFPLVLLGFVIVMGRVELPLSQLELLQEIPEDLYIAVAETLAWAYSLDVAARSAWTRR